MAYLIKHLFDPDFDQTNLAPRERQDGSVDHYDLGYVQNVVQGQELAELVDLGDAKGSERTRRFAVDKAEFPMGEGVMVDPSDPLKLLAATNGYVFYLDGGITVNPRLRVPGDVDFSTGNIAFVAELLVQGSVKSGFQVRADTVHVKQSVDGARVEAMRDIVCEGGVKGADQALLHAGQDIKVAFTENALLKAGRNVLIKGSCLHTDVFAGNRLAVGGRLVGGDIHCWDYAYVAEQLGGGLGAETSVSMGYDPMLIHADYELNERIRLIREEISKLEKMVDKGGEYISEFQPRLERQNKVHAQLIKRKSALWERIHGTERLKDCKIVVPGAVRPGVEINIGPAYLKVDDFLEDVFFYFKDNEVHIGTPAPRKR